MRRTRLARSRTGANAVEFALTLPILVLILSGVVDYSYFLHRQYVLVNAVSQGARAGASSQPGVAVAVAQEVAQDAWTHSGLSGFPDFVVTSGPEGPPDETLIVNGTIGYAPLVGLIPVPGENSHTTTMRMDRQSNE